MSLSTSRLLLFNGSGKAQNTHLKVTIKSKSTIFANCFFVFIINDLTLHIIIIFLRIVKSDF